MAIITDDGYKKKGGENSGRDSLNFTPEKHHVAAVDSPHGSDPAGARAGAQQEQEADSSESRGARHGATMATEKAFKGEPLAFTATAGMFTSGPSVGAYFHRAVTDSGGVRQGPSYCSDPAPGVYQCKADHTLTLDSLSKPDENGHLVHQDAGRTFEKQRHSHWSHDKWGG